MKVFHLDLFVSLENLQETILFSVTDVGRLQRHKQICRTKNKANLLNDRQIANCVGRYSAGILYCYRLSVSSQSLHNVTEITKWRRCLIKRWVWRYRCHGINASTDSAPSAIVACCLTASRDDVVIVLRGPRIILRYLCASVSVSARTLSCMPRSDKHHT